MTESTSEVEEDYEGLSKETQPSILVLGCGGAGCNTVSHMAEEDLDNVKLVAVNTDAQDLIHSDAEEKILIGREITGGLGTGSNLEKGEKSALENKETLKEVLSGYELVFLTCGMGGGTGAGAGPVIADIAKGLGALTVGVVTLPFKSEGEIRNKNSIEGLFNFREAADTTIVIPDDKLLEIAPDLSLEEAFKLADSVLVDTITGITELMSETGLINLDFEDVRTTFEDGDMGVVGFGEASGVNRAERTVDKAIENPLMDMKVENAKRALISITGSEDMTLDEAEKVTGIVSEKLQPDAKVAWGARISEDLTNTVMVMLIVSGAEKLEGRDEVVDLGLEFL
ncbi:hypothetical protein AKJ40_02230 [candidate division MSBL1 archaeon SCGC-AAA259M10]|uniref:Cell division protein FtsZ n=2 Tax=candidate division MSBL1 TaxID=215777 RepID=A0A133U6X7_9EURY|nr:hypothetical protein AKJ61_01795 [candidate division MSBL1 archaeon SCGC-AAA259B11]KXA99910.1 hypothetical protein AKJ40_02230 [candidate division MSBL1 archaeon SCGC-AAA259M10]